MIKTRMLKIAVLLISVALLSGIAMPAFAATADKKLVINVTYEVINDEDFGWGSWYWALTNYMVRVQVWQLPDGSYFALKTYTGSFFVPQGALSPNVGTAEPENGHGRLDSYYTVSFTGTLNTALQLRGFIGTKDFGGSIDDILLGTGGSGAPNGFNWIAEYFPGYANRVFLTDVWTYKLCDGKDATARNMIQTVYSGPPTIEGDIIT